MPTTNPRVNVTLSPALDALVSRLAGHQGVSKSQVLRELLETAEPALQRVVALMDAASSARTELHTGLSRSLGRAQDAIEDGLAVAMARIDAGTVDLVSQAEGVRGRRPRRVAQRPGGGVSPSSTPVPVTRGSGSGKTLRKGVKRG